MAILAALQFAPVSLDTTPMLELVAAADFLIGKPGGLTSAEARASGLPMAIVHAAPSREEHNTSALLEAGCAIRCSFSQLAAWKIDRLVQRPDAVARMTRMARVGATPEAGIAVAEGMVEVANLSSRL